MRKTDNPRKKPFAETPAEDKDVMDCQELTLSSPKPFSGGKTQAEDDLEDQTRIWHASATSRQFFADDCEGRGLYKIVCRSQFHIDHLDEDLEPEEVKMCMALCRLTNELSRSQRGDICPYIEDGCRPH